MLCCVPLMWEYAEVDSANPGVSRSHLERRARCRSTCREVVSLKVGDLERHHLLVCDLDALLVGVRVEHFPDPQPGLGGGRRDRLDHHLVGFQGRPRQFVRSDESSLIWLSRSTHTSLRE
jgi:hypothetical protein